jgi:hypothetical protein
MSPSGLLINNNPENVAVKATNAIKINNIVFIY